MLHNCSILAVVGWSSATNVESEHRVVDTQILSVYNNVADEIFAIGRLFPRTSRFIERVWHNVIG